MGNIRFTSGFTNTREITMGEDWNHYDDEMAFLTYWVLYHYAFDDTLKQEYAKMIRDHWRLRNPNAMHSGISWPMEHRVISIWNLPSGICKGFQDRNRYVVKTHTGKDLEFLPNRYPHNFREQTTTRTYS